MTDSTNSIFSYINTSSDDFITNEWVSIQKTTFTNWCNKVLSHSHPTIKDLYTDLRDGVILVRIYEKITQQKINGYFPNPKALPHKLENVSLVMKEMNKDGVKFVNIEPLDICDGNPKLILAFIWHMILYYQVGMVMPNTNKKKEKQVQTLTPKALLLKLINGLIPQSKVFNLTTDWNSGKKLAALVETFSPGSCPSYDAWNDRNALLNATTALCLAEVHLGVPVLVEPHHMAAKNVDELSMITYLSSFTKDGGVAEKYFIKTLTEKFPSIADSLTNMTTDWNNGVLLCKILKECHPDAIKYGFFDDFSKIESETQYRQYCIANIKQAMQDARYLFKIEQNIEPELFVSKNVPALAVMSYVAPFLHLNPIKKTVKPEKIFATDLELILERENLNFFPDTEIKFKIKSKVKIQKNKINIIIKDTKDVKNEIIYDLKNIDDFEYHLIFTPKDITEYLIKVTLDDENIVNSPISIETFDPAFKNRDIIVEMDKNEFKMGEFVKFNVNLKQAIDSIFCYIEDVKNQKKSNCEIIRISENNYKIFFKIIYSGDQDVVIKSDVKEIFRKRIKCLDNIENIKILTKNVISANDNNIILKIDTIDAGVGQLEIKFKCEDSLKSFEPKVRLVESRGIYTATCSDFPEKVYNVIAHVFWNSILIPSDPIKIKIYNLQDIKISDKNLTKIIHINRNYEIYVNLTDLNIKLEIKGFVEKLGFTGDFNKIFDLKFVSVEKLIYMTNLYFSTSGIYRIRIQANTSEIYKNKILNVIDISEIKSELVNFDGKINHNIEFKVTIPQFACADFLDKYAESDAESYEKSVERELSCCIKGPEGPLKIKPKFLNFNDSNYNFIFKILPIKSGEYRIGINFGTIELPGFPKVLKIIDDKNLEIKLINVEKDRLRYFLARFDNEFTVTIPKEAGKGILNGYFTYVESKKNEKNILNFIQDHKSGRLEKYKCKINPCLSNNINLRIFYDDLELLDSPYSVKVFDLQSSESSLTHELSPVCINQRYSFCVFFPFISELNDIISDLKCSVIPPEGDILFPSIKSSDTDNPLAVKWFGREGNIYQVEFSPQYPGEYVINFTCSNHPVPGFPKVLEVKTFDPKSISKILVNIPEKDDFRIGDLCSIIVDARQSERGILKAIVKDSNGNEIPHEIIPVRSKDEIRSKKTHDKGSIFQVDFNLQTPGPHEVSLFYNNNRISEPLIFKASELIQASLANNIVIDGFVDEILSVVIDNVGEGFEDLDCICLDPNDNNVKVWIEPSDKVEGAYELFIEPKVPGMHKIEVKMKGKSIVGSPFYFNVSYPVDAKNVQVYGDGLISGIINPDKGIIFLHVDKAGGGLLQVAIQGPKDGFKLKINYKEDDYNETPSVVIDYQPKISGLYIINILWSGEHVPGSPFQVYNCENQKDFNEISHGKIPLQYTQFSSKQEEGFIC